MVWSRSLAVALLVMCVESSLLDRFTGAHRQAGSVLTFDGPYGIAAAANLSRYRTGLFKQTMDFGLTRHKGHERFDVFNPIIQCPPGKALEMVGAPPGVDGGKWLCMPLDYLLPEGPCNIYSFGSNNDYSFEEAILNRTKCNVFTYDCTVDGHSVDPSRHKFFKKCIGPPSVDPKLSSWEQTVAANGHSSVYLLKIDIEGHEWATLGDWTANTPALPSIVSMEVHLNLDPVWQKREYMPSDLALFFGHMASLGYAIVSREDNKFYDSGSEFTFIRVEHPRTYHHSSESAGGTNFRLQRLLGRA